MNWKGPDGHAYFIATHPEVYVPSDDTFLLASAVAALVRPGMKFLEVGCGAALVSILAARAGAKVTATDLNPHAINIALHNARQNKVPLEIVQTDLLDGLDGPFDLVAFNPPYLPTAPDDVVPGPINLAFDGGKDGNGTVLRFAAQLGRLAVRPPTVLVVHSSLSDPAPLAAAMETLGYACDVTHEESHFFEKLAVRRFRQP